MHSHKMESKTFPMEMNTSTNIGKQAWIEKAMQDRRSEWTENKKLTIYCGTWNVNAKKPSEESITPWLVPPPNHGANKEAKVVLPDVYCLGFQEVVDLNAQSLLVDHNASKEWEEHIQQTMLTKKDPLFRHYVLKKTVHLVGLLMLVYVKKALSSYVRTIQAEVCGVGILGYGGNKGAVAVRMTIYDTSICFVNSHLAAHKNNVQGRNSDFRNICKRLRFKSPMRDEEEEEQIGDHNYTFWIGDLNYRLTSTDLTEVYREIQDKNIGALIRSDQLVIEKAAGRAFQGWHEGPITFLPTYKYETGTDRYDRREDKKKRFPAWCDRIQWKVDGSVAAGTDVKMVVTVASDLHCEDERKDYQDKNGGADDEEEGNGEE